MGEIGTANRIAPSEKTDLAVLAEKLEWSDKLYALCERAEHMPVWPFNFTIISRFAGLFGSVILAIGLGLAITQLADFGG